jgi:ribosomal protein S18 acetylase RimI-like enzyme
MIVYTDSADGLCADQLRGFFVGWPNPPTPETHLKLLKKSDEIVLALDDETGNIVGFINANTDYLLSAYIPLLEVLPEYQKRGMGSELVRRMLAKFRDFYMIDLMCDTDKQPFYEQFGMRPATGMMIRNFNNQAGRTR